MAGTQDLNNVVRSMRERSYIGQLMFFGIINHFCLVRGNPSRTVCVLELSEEIESITVWGTEKENRELSWSEWLVSHNTFL